MQQPPPGSSGEYGSPPQQGHGAGYPPPSPKKKGMSTGMIVLVVFGCLFGGCVMCSVVRSANKKGSTPPTATAESAKTDSSAESAELPAQQKAAGEAKAVNERETVVVSSSQLFNDYHSNEVAADNKYKGKQLLVTGTVASIDKGPFGGLILRLATSNQFMSTMCKMNDSENATMAQLQKGKQVRVLCESAGMMIGTPSLSDCVFK